MLYRSPIDEFIHRRIAVLHRDRPLFEAARAMREKNMGCVLVSDHQGFIVGIVTDRDLACRAMAEQVPFDQPIAQIMTPQPVFVEPNATVEQVVHLMEENGIRRVPVMEIDPHGRAFVAGIVTLDDLVAAEMVDSFRLARIVRGQVRRRVGEFAHQRGQVTPMVDAQGRVVTDKEVLNRYFFEIHLRSGADKFGLKESDSEGIACELLQTLVSRLHHSAAQHLLAQLPPPLQDEWMDNSFGPDRRSSLPRLLARVQQLGYCHAQNAQEAVMAIGRGWASMVPAAELAHLRGQLPPDFSEMLLPAEDFERRKWAHEAA